MIEHQGATKVADIRAVDDDERPNGPPFAFSIDPKAPEEVRRAFRLDNNPSEYHALGTSMVILAYNGVGFYWPNSID